MEGSRKRAADDNEDVSSSYAHNNINNNARSRQDVSSCKYARHDVAAEKCFKIVLESKYIRYFGLDTVKDIKTKTGAKLLIHNGKESNFGHNEKICVLIGSNIALKKAFLMIRNVILKFEPDSYTARKTLKMVINVSAAGVIIGKRGFKIKELKEKYTIIITINPYDSIDSSERILYLEGEWETVQKILDIAVNCNSMYPTTDTVNSDDYVNPNVPRDAAIPSTPIGAAITQTELGTHKATPSGNSSEITASKMPVSVTNTKKENSGKKSEIAVYKPPLISFAGSKPEVAVFKSPVSSLMLKGNKYEASFYKPPLLSSFGAVKKQEIGVFKPLVSAAVAARKKAIYSNSKPPKHQPTSSDNVPVFYKGDFNIGGSSSTGTGFGGITSTGGGRFNFGKFTYDKKTAEVKVHQSSVSIKYPLVREVLLQRNLSKKKIAELEAAIDLLKENNVCNLLYVASDISPANQSPCIRYLESLIIEQRHQHQELDNTNLESSEKFPIEKNSIQEFKDHTTSTDAGKATSNTTNCAGKINSSAQPSHCSPRMNVTMNRFQMMPYGRMTTAMPSPGAALLNMISTPPTHLQQPLHPGHIPLPPRLNLNFPPFVDPRHVSAYRFHRFNAPPPMHQTKPPGAPPRNTVISNNQTAKDLSEVGSKEETNNSSSSLNCDTNSFDTTQSDGGAEVSSEFIDKGITPSLVSIAHRVRSDLSGHQLVRRQFNCYKEEDQLLPEHLKKFQTGRDIYIEELIIGVIIGPEGCSLERIMKITKTTITVSDLIASGQRRTLSIEPRHCRGGSCRQRACRVRNAYQLLEDMRCSALQRLQNTKYDHTSDDYVKYHDSTSDVSCSLLDMHLRTSTSVRFCNDES